ncbi:MAG: CHAD domain-containing protein [Pseudochelatococcus sp.]|jgi:triphosphatase|uniref:CYTH and CHAD domain-containing protein n=1 Tax=Pseudochelatococcus sp. TaxID=2020869 RepID=UPI003D9360A7
MPEEIELKLALNPAALLRLSTHPAFLRLQAGRGARKRLRSVYFDTPEHDLRHAGVSLRIRTDGEQPIQTIKNARDRGRLVMERDEWEYPVTGTVPDFGRAEGTALAPLIADEKRRAAIRPMFIVNVDREVVLLDYHEALIEVALDHGRVSVGRRARRFAEVELELKRGDAASLYALAQEIAAIVSVRPGSLTKSDRGYDLVTGREPAVTKAPPLDIAPGTPTGDAFRIIARSCLKQLLANEEVLRRARASGAVHQARVSLRRLRAAISVFRKVVDDDRRIFISGELRWMANRLGAARDLDVYIENVLTPAKAEHGDDAAFAELLASYDEKREHAYDGAQRTIASRRFTRAVIATLAWAEAGPWTRDTGKQARKRRNQPIERFAARQLDRRRRKIIAAAADLAALTPPERHEVRIALKKLRYASEFFAGLFHEPETRKRYKAAVSAMSKLQDLLGELNDIAMGRERDTVSEAERELRDEHAAHESELLARAIKTYETFVETPPFWHDGE